MPTSAKPKSQHGESGPEDKDPQLDNLLPTEMEACESPNTQEKLDPVSDPAQPVATVADDSADFVSIPTLSPSERKLADRMTRDIAQHLGLSGRSRSIRI